MKDFVEIYKPIIIENVKPYYTISTYGNIYSSYSNTFIIPHENHNGYLQASLMTNTGRIFRKVHRLVMLTFMYFIGCEDFQVNHKDGNKHNNRLNNLEWVTAKENINHAIKNNLRSSVGENNPQATITKSDAIQISKMILQGYSDDYIANIIHCSSGVVKEIAFGRAWSYLFDNNILNDMKHTRTGYYIMDNEKHLICEYYQKYANQYKQYNRVKLLTEDALMACNIPINDKSIRIARRLFYRLQNPDITSKYIY